MDQGQEPFTPLSLIPLQVRHVAKKEEGKKAFARWQIHKEDNRKALPFILFLKQVQLSLILSWHARDSCQFDDDDDIEQTSGHMSRS